MINMSVGWSGCYGVEPHSFFVFYFGFFLFPQIELLLCHALYFFKLILKRKKGLCEGFFGGAVDVEDNRGQCQALGFFIRKLNVVKLSLNEGKEQNMRNEHKIYLI